ncbi:T-cell immunoglobulin and mucin domain-containing protein 4-like isoform X2 [Trichosurus vulpecula]|uniref:T-cell immunoglobulin and mucin domain-containing protein 4-like isoform X2 n=1 Tax=Trichosurus vulpecula TaxID=9337 RepID=UPI00186B1D1B|nr:T-cell immunoglobulin and mucin domain-containing protein 4-like isoform X2 [Trichosurus vulpecula]
MWAVTFMGHFFCPEAQAISTTVMGFLGHSVQLPCSYSVSNRQTYVMCWGKDACPSSKCGSGIIRTNGRQVTWSKSSKYQLRGNIGRGDVTLTIQNANVGDIGTYCCRIEVPGWFNDIKKEVFLRLERAPTTTTRRTTTTRQTTTTHPTTTHPLTTTQLATTLLPATTHLSTTSLPATTHLSTTSLPAITTHLATTTCPATTATTALQITTSAIPNLTTVMTHQLTTVTLKSTTVALPQKSTSNQAITSALTTLPLTEVAPVTTETTSFPKNDSEFEKVRASGDPELLIIIVPLVGFVILLALLAFILRGKIIRKNYSVTYKRSNNCGEVSSTLSTLPSRIEDDEEGLFNL